MKNVKLVQRRSVMGNRHDGLQGTAAQAPRWVLTGSLPRCALRLAQK